MPNRDYFEPTKNIPGASEPRVSSTAEYKSSSYAPPQKFISMGPKLEHHSCDSGLVIGRSMDTNDRSSPRLSSTFSEVSISDKGTVVHSSPRSHVMKTQSAQSTPCDRDMSEDARVQQIKPRDLAALLQSPITSPFVILDFRTSSQFQSSRLPDAVNISVPTTLLKRSSYTVSKIIDSLTNREAQETVRKWETCDNLVLYDHDSFNVGPGTPIYQVALKFSHRDVPPTIYVVKGGFMAISRDFSSLTETSVIKAGSTSASMPLDNSRSDEALAALASLRCALPMNSARINPFFNNIRQNQDLIGGVGEPISLRIPSLPSGAESRLPLWLRSLLSSKDSAKIVADKFLQIELEEQSRMQRVLAAGQYSSQSIEDERYSIAAGVERGDKNRYNNIWPYENSRVHLQDLSSSESDYINASHLHFGGSAKTYIATQGPLPTTTRDFWQVVWENDVHTIVMLTKTTEGGQAKCHTYWEDDTRMEPYSLSLIEEVRTYGHYSSTDSTPFTVRKFSLQDTRHLQGSAREITQIQFPDWPDLHVIDPESILALLREVHVAEVVTEIPAYKRRKSIGSIMPARQNRPVLSHCSAGCGRTGTFCTIDTVIDVVRGQLEGESYKLDEYIKDPIEEVVRTFREQRLSIVQTLRQYVLCYDAVILYATDHLKRTMQTQDDRAS